MKFLVIVVIVMTTSTASGCGGNVFIEGPVTISLSEASFHDAVCEWHVRTTDDRVLMFTIVKLAGTLNIYDGPTASFKSLIAPDVLTEKKSPEKIFYSTGAVTLLRFVRDSSKQHDFQVKVQPAVNCPVNVGIQSSCARVMNDGSCHCVSWISRNWTASRSFCESKGMQLVSFETEAEEVAVERTWTSADLSAHYWTSGSDEGHETFWVWTSTGRPLTYDNWYPGQPDNFKGAQHYLVKNFFGTNTTLWDDERATYAACAICEADP